MGPGGDQLPRRDLAQSRGVQRYARDRRARERHADADRFAFGIGAGIASIWFFCAPGYGARCLAPMLGRPVAWRSFEFASGLLMWVLALNLIASCARS